jgi:hypothetical protein
VQSGLVPHAIVACIISSAFSAAPVRGNRGCADADVVQPFIGLSAEAVIILWLLVMAWMHRIGPAMLAAAA